MSSSDEGTQKVVKSKKGSKSEKQDFQIKPAKGGPSLDTSTWPLLLKVKPDIYIINLIEL